MHPGRRNLMREAAGGRSSGRWRLLIAAMAAVLAVGGCQRQPQPPPASAPSGAATTRSAPLQSWNDGVSRRAIVDFVERVTREGGADFVPPAERIAAFDNDGTLWAEQPIYFQLAFALDRVKALASEHPEWRTRQPFKGVLEGDMKAVAATGERGLLELVATTHLGNTTDEFARAVSAWLASARHPKTNRPYTAMVYKPMLDLLAYLRTNGSWSI